MFNSQSVSIQKLHKPLFEGIAKSLKDIFIGKRHADKVIEQLLKSNKKWGSRDRRFVAEAIYDIVRNFRLLSYLAESETNFWIITGVYLKLKGMTLPEWPDFKHIIATDYDVAIQKLNNDFCITQSYSDELNEIGVGELGKELWEKEATAMNEVANITIRVNSIKTTKEKLASALKQEGVDFREVKNKDALQVEKRINLFQTEAFKNGWFEMQDSGSQEIGLFCEPKEGDFIIDACAGGGGKTLQLAALMKNKGKIISLDVNEKKLGNLKTRAKRAGVQCAEARLIEGEKTINELKQKADLLLLDVPCSGVGVIKRNPDTKWKINSDALKKTSELQKEILSNYSKMVKPGGKLIYSTCSIFPSENKKQVLDFLEQNTEFKFISDKTIYPSEGNDGFYMCKLIKE